MEWNVEILLVKKLTKLLNKKKVIKISNSDKIEQFTERLLFASRWILAPIYLILVLILFLILFKFITNVVHFVSIMSTLTYNEWIIEILEFLDLSLLANLVLIVAFSGYENFVSKIDVAQGHIDRPSWMGSLDFSGLKLKIIGSIVAISLVSLLQDFLNVAGELNHEVLFWRVTLHLTFVVTGIIFAAMEILAEKRRDTEEE